MSGSSLLTNAICRDALSSFTPMIYRSQRYLFSSTTTTTSSRLVLQKPQLPSIATAARLRLYSTPSRPRPKTESAESLYSREILPTPANASSTTGRQHPPPPPPKISALTSELMNKPLEISSKPPMERMPPPRLGPNAGRSVAVKNGDIQGALLRLQRLVAENKVKSDAHRQKFHERKGLKRKRLRSERFRRRFKEGFKKMVGVVLDMRRQGL